MAAENVDARNALRHGRRLALAPGMQINIAKGETNMKTVQAEKYRRCGCLFRTSVAAPVLPCLRHGPWREIAAELRVYLAEARRDAPRVRSLRPGRRVSA